MSTAQNGTTELRCSFCNKSQAEVGKMISADNGAAICHQCVDVCNDIIADSSDRRSPSWEVHDADGGPDLLPFRCPACGHRWKIKKP